jgi:hypothetical protein
VGSEVLQVCEVGSSSSGSSFAIRCQGMDQLRRRAALSSVSASSWTIINCLNNILFWHYLCTLYQTFWFTVILNCKYVQMLC